MGSRSIVGMLLCSFSDRSDLPTLLCDEWVLFQPPLSLHSLQLWPGRAEVFKKPINAVGDLGEYLTSFLLKKHLIQSDTNPSGTAALSHSFYSLRPNIKSVCFYKEQNKTHDIFLTSLPKQSFQGIITPFWSAHKEVQERPEWVLVRKTAGSLRIPRELREANQFCIAPFSLLCNKVTACHRVLQDAYDDIWVLILIRYVHAKIWFLSVSLLNVSVWES